MKTIKYFIAIIGLALCGLQACMTDGRQLALLGCARVGVHGFFSHTSLQAAEGEAYDCNKILDSFHIIIF